MKPAATLRELIKPPFRWVYNSIISGNEEILSLGISDMFNKNRFYSAFKRFVVQALNEKWERDFGGLKKWLLDDDDSLLSCPYCRSEYSYEVLPERLLDWENYSFCSHCGRRLSPPEEEEQDESSL